MASSTGLFLLSYDVFIEVSFRPLGYEATLCNDEMTDEYNTVDKSIFPTNTLAMPMTSVTALCLLHLNYRVSTTSF